ncbi:nickel pincer cofactor biosynthesis protein LarC [Hespellia stercorisuis]|uniref:Pyridinium-3,5-bisthiocarboxylic acid mononucleotide nickel insertion protein n=1 Tax=Hespellia stercorisuis DSM 15480 TaxID=1121950 RepID=A0A1M6NJ86_9FIRM|nr:nickel pincer cofactor biosynthesis protein LarC [Hespellia stercorisuis]SHJ95729.1 hypothetical protein SAMN02745243_01832 [Hespellia stercorisuis DSM 15480]
MSNTLYLECYSGISGDMSVAALIDLGVEKEMLVKALKSLPLDGYEIQISRKKKAGLDVCDFDVVLDAAHENHDHDMAYLYGKEQPEMHVHVHQHDADHEHMHHSGQGENSACPHSHEHLHSPEDETGHDHHEHVHGTQDHNHGTQDHEHGTHAHTHGAHDHVHRGLADVTKIINGSGLTERAKNIAIRIFTVLGEAEAKAHGETLESVHFHEVGAVDSIVDIAAIAVCMDALDIEDVIVPELCEGKGFVRCQHGVLPVPVPAVANIVTANGLRLHITDMQGEMVTPTGAAFAAAVKTSDVLPEEFAIKKIGIGAGKREYERPSLLRAMLIEPIENTKQSDADSSSDVADYIYKLESNIDDCTGEMLGLAMEKLFEAGARDVSYMPVFMKKNRPAYQLNVICSEKDVSALEQIIFEETTTIGIRRVRMERTILKREMALVQTSFGEVRVKVCDFDSGTRCYPEYESVAKICRQRNLSYRDVYMAVHRECEALQRRNV